MTTLHELRAQRAEAEALFTAAMETISMGRVEPEIIAEAIGYHREVCAIYGAELSLIGHGTIPATQPHPPTPHEH